MNKLVQAIPVSLVLTYKNVHTIEFNIKTLISLTESYSGGIIGNLATNTLEIILKYDEVIRYNQNRPK